MNESLWWTATLVVPAVAIVGYWWIARRQVRSATAALQAALDRERRVVAHVSHRLRNPLTVIYGFTETLVDPSILDDPAEVASVAAMVNAEALDVSRTVEDLVAAQDVDRGDLAVRSVGFDPRDEIERVVTPFRRLGSPISIEAWSGTAFSDPLRFRHILQTLVSNAARHGGGEISIFADLDGDWYRCTVADDGPGLPDPTADALFGSRRATSRAEAVGASGGAGDPGRDATPPSGESGPALAIDVDTKDGLGLGLAVAIRVARHLGGDLTYERAPAFSAFTLSLPTAGWPEPLVPLVPPAASDGGESVETRPVDTGARDAITPEPGPTVSFVPEPDPDEESRTGDEAGDPADRHDEDAVRS